MTSRINGVRIAGIAGAVPAETMNLEQTAAVVGVSRDEAEKIAKMTGVRNRHVAPRGMCTSDLAYRSATKLLDELGWERKSVDALVMVSQTHDYDLPATACCLQERLGIPKSCACFDMMLGCSGYVYGLWVCSTLMSAGAVRRALLLAGDTSTWSSSPQDRATIFLFGDAGTATALERDETAPPMSFVLGTDGSGRDYLIVPGGGYRNRVTAENLERHPGPDGTPRSCLDLYMHGGEVFAFTLRQVPALISELLCVSGWTLDQMDAFVPHQANMFMLQHLSKRLKIPPEKLVINMDEYGNTSSASIPLAMSDRLAPRLRNGTANLILAGFGIGWSWGAVALNCGPMVMPGVMLMEEEALVGG
jgi:3-oxoacyl-[acyl-carrier-protein] synthase-3